MKFARIERWLKEKNNAKNLKASAISKGVVNDVCWHG
jgi:hypothetical protein